MEENIFVEQPKEKDNVPVADANEDLGTASSVSSGSQFGKFKDADSLLNAYNNLQAEFTKKCQKLSELEKEKVKQEEDNLRPIFDKDDWQSKVSTFLNSNQNAKQFASQISQEILNNPNLINNENALDIAWAKVVSKNYKLPADVVSDDKFIEDFVMSSPQIKQKIISNYIQELENNKIPPIVTKSQGGDIAFAQTKQATTLSEAKQLVEAIFNS